MCASRWSMATPVTARCADWAFTSTATRASLCATPVRPPPGCWPRSPTCDCRWWMSPRATWCATSWCGRCVRTSWLAFRWSTRGTCSTPSKRSTRSSDCWKTNSPRRCRPSSLAAPDARPRARSLVGHLQHQLAEVLAREQLQQRRRELGDATAHDVFLALDAAVLQVTRQFGHGLRKALGVVEHHHAFHACAVHQQRHVVLGHVHRAGVVVLADRAADHHARLACQ